MKGRTAIITGVGRSQGIGTALCKALANEGADIFFTYWHPYDLSMPWGSSEPSEGSDQLRQELMSMGIRCAFEPVNLAAEGSARTVLDLAENALGSVSILVNNACHSVNDDLQTLTAQALDAHYAVNVRATVMLSVEFARRFTQGKGGRIISLTSGQSLGPMAGEISYATTKGAIDAFTRTFAAEAGPKGITVNAINPGPTDTGWMTEPLRDELRARFPLGRVGMPQDAAKLAAFLAGDEAEWITGQVLHSTGGFN